MLRTTIFQKKTFVLQKIKKSPFQQEQLSEPFLSIELYISDLIG